MSNFSSGSSQISKSNSNIDTNKDFQKAIIKLVKDTLKNNRTPRVDSAIVDSYNTTTNKATVHLPDSTVTYDVLNLSGQNIVATNTVEILSFEGGSLSNGFVIACRNNASVLVGSTGSFTSANGKTITVTNGLITAIV